jgi:RNA-directed DNA polymerase
VRQGAPAGTHHIVRSGRGAAIISLEVSAPDHVSRLARDLTRAFLTSSWRLELLAESGAAELGHWPTWIEALALSVVSAFRTAPANRMALEAYITEFLVAHPAAPAEPAADAEPAPSVVSRYRRDWPVAPIDSPARLAELLELSGGQLEWLADVKGLERTAASERLRNYRYAIVPRRCGLARVIEAPKLRLKEVQRWILREILDAMPVHDACHGFTAGRSVLSNAALHVGQTAVLGLDLKDFFASVAARRVFGMFQLAGYRRSVAHLLSGLCTNVVPDMVWAAMPPARDPRLVGPRFWLGRQLATPHLPQGAPTSPALANLLAFRLDRRLHGLAGAFGFRYSRYADDLTFSGSLALRAQRNLLEQLVAEIARDEGFTLNAGKSRLRTAASRQSVCGVVVNVRPNLARSEYDQLRAILHNARRDGPESQNRAGAEDFRAHVRGRIAWLSSLNPERGESLLRRFEEVDWSGGG